MSADDVSNQSIVVLVEALREKSKEQNAMYEKMLETKNDLIIEQRAEAEIHASALRNISNASFWSRFKYMLSGDISKVRD